MTHARAWELLNICLEQTPSLTTAELFPAFRERGYRDNRFTFDELRREVLFRRRQNAKEREKRRVSRPELRLAA